MFSQDLWKLGFFTKPVKGFLKIQIYYVLCIFLIHVLTETFAGLQQVKEAEFPIEEVMVILDNFCLCTQ